MWLLISVNRDVARECGDAGRTGLHLLYRGGKRAKIVKKSRESSDCKFHMCLRGIKTKHYSHHYRRL